MARQYGVSNINSFANLYADIEKSINAIQAENVQWKKIVIMVQTNAAAKENLKRLKEKSLVSESK